LQREKDTRQIHADGALPGLIARGPELRLHRNSGVGDHNIGRPGLIERTLQRCAVGDVHRISGAADSRAGGGNGIRALQVEYRHARTALR